MCALFAGARVSWNGGAPDCGGIKVRLAKNGGTDTSDDDYKILTSSDYLTCSDYLRRGDIVVRENRDIKGNRHAIMILGNGIKVPDSDTDLSFWDTPLDIPTGNTWIEGYFALRIAAAITEIGTTKASVSAKITKIENKNETLLEDSTKIAKYNWSWELISLATDGAEPSTDELTIDSGDFSFDLENLSPNTSYKLRIIAKETNSKVEFSSATVIFTTAMGHPTGPRDLTADVIDSDTPLNKAFALSFREPLHWNSDTFIKGYRTSLIVNGKTIAFNDEVVAANSASINKTVKFDDLTNNQVISYDDTVQIGVQPWFKDNNKKYIFKGNALQCTKPVYIKPPLKIINKVYLNVSDNFKQTIVYNK
jgi:hypothetical protein